MYFFSCKGHLTTKQTNHWYFDMLNFNEDTFSKDPIEIALYFKFYEDFSAQKLKLK